MADLVIVMGTSLSVSPFANLPQLAGQGVPRLLFNLEPVGDFGSRPDDVIVLGDCDSGVRKLADILGWRDELEALWEEVGSDAKVKEAEKLQQKREAMSRDEKLAADYEEINGESEATLKSSKDHMERIKNMLDKGSKAASAKDTEVPGLQEEMS